MSGITGYFLFGTAVFASVVAIGAGYWLAGGAALVLACVVFILWPVDVS